MIDHLNLFRRYLPVVLVSVAASIYVLAASTLARAENWGEISHVELTGKSADLVDFKGTASTIAFAADPDDRSYYIGDEPKAGEYRLQRFVTAETGGKTEAKVEGSISFSPPAAKRSHGGEGENGVGLQLTVDPAHNRVYALVVYRRRELAEKEEKELEKEEKELEKEGKKCEEPKTCYQRFPLDSEELAAGELYAFEYTGGSLVSAKVKEGAPIPLIGESSTGFKDQGENPKEALLNPRGMAVDPATGNLVIVGDQDQEADEKVEKEEAEKQCRAVGQFVLLEEKSGKLASGKLGHRYVDNADALHPDQLGCGEAGPVEHTEVPLPLSPAITPGGNLLAYSGAETEGQIWEFPTPGSSSGEGEVETHPHLLYDEAQLGLLLDIEPPEEGAGPMMSFVPGAANEGTIYVSADFESFYPAPLVLHYTEAGGQGQVTETGWTGGSTVQQCGIPRFEEKVLVSGLQETKDSHKGGVLVLAPWVQEGTDTAFLEAFEFGPGGSVTGCPTPSLTTPHVISGENENAHEVVVGEPVLISSDLTNADAKSVEWKFKYTDSETGESGEETVDQESAEFESHAGKYEFKPLEYGFKHTGDYEITEIAKTDDLAQEEAQAAEVLSVTVFASPLRIKFTAPKAVRVNEEEAEISATVTDPGATELQLKKVLWNFGDGSEVEQHPASVKAESTELHIKHAFASRCGKGKCKITLTVEGAAAEGKPAVSHIEITVNESHAEELQHKNEAEEKAAEEAAKHKAEEEAAAHKKAEEEAAAKHRAEEEAAKHKAEEEAAAHKKAEEEAAAKKRKEEEEKARKAHPTRAQLLAKALKVCKKQPKHKRAKCETAARKKYGSKPKKKHK